MAILHTLVKNKDIYTLTNLGVDTLSYNLKKDNCSEVKDIVLGTLAQNAEVTFIIQQDGDYVLTLNDESDTLTVSFVYYENFLKSLVESTKDILCGCRCKECDNCHSDCDENLCLVNGYQTYFNLTSPLYQEYYKSIIPYFRCRLQDDLICTTTNQLILGQSDCAVVTKEHVMMFYLAIYYKQLSQSADEEETEYLNSKFYIKPILNCIRKSGINLTDIQELINTPPSAITLLDTEYNIPGEEQLEGLVSFEFEFNDSLINISNNISYSTPIVLVIDSLPLIGDLTYLGNPVYEGQVFLISQLADLTFELESTISDSFPLETTFEYHIVDNNSVESNIVSATLNLLFELFEIDAGPNQELTYDITSSTLTGSIINLGMGTSITSVVWEVLSGQSTTITSPNTLITGITGLLALTTRVFQLTVTNNVGQVATDTVEVEVTNEFIVDAGPNQTIIMPDENEFATCTVSATQIAGGDNSPIVSTLWVAVDSDDEIVTSYTGGYDVTFSATFPIGVYTLTFTATNESEQTDSDSFILVVVDNAETAFSIDAGENQVVGPTSFGNFLASIVHLEEGASLDTVEWTLLSMSEDTGNDPIFTPGNALNCAISNLDSSVLYTFLVTATDTLGNIAQDTVTWISDAEPPVTPFTVDAGEDQELEIDTTETYLSGFVRSYGNGDSIDFNTFISSPSWELVSATPTPPSLPIIVYPTLSMGTPVTNLFSDTTYVFRLYAANNGDPQQDDTDTVSIVVAGPPEPFQISIAFDPDYEGTGNDARLISTIVNEGEGNGVDYTWLWAKLDTNENDSLDFVILTPDEKDSEIDVTPVTDLYCEFRLKGINSEGQIAFSNILTINT